MATKKVKAWRGDSANPFVRRSIFWNCYVKAWLVRCLFIAPAGGNKETPDQPRPPTKVFLVLFFQKKNFLPPVANGPHQARAGLAGVAFSQTEQKTFMKMVQRGSGPAGERAT